MKIVVLTDVHANLPALQAAVETIHREGYDVVFHIGDAFGIGPYPAECLDLLLNLPNVQCVTGNHEACFVDGLPESQPAWMSDAEAEHQRWTQACLDQGLRSLLAQWPYTLHYEFEGVKAAFLHYGLLPSGRDFVPIIRQATAAELNRMFAAYDKALIVYGHDHAQSDVQGQSRYVNPGSLGCYDRAIARYCVVEFQRGQYQVEHRGVPYDDASLFRAFERRNVPDRQFIYQAFFGGRFQG